MLINLLLLFLGLTGFRSNADNCSVAWVKSLYPASVIAACNTAVEMQGLSDVEKDVVLITNIVRYDPSLFAQKVVRPFFTRNCDKFLMPDTNSIYLQSLYKDLKKAIPMQLLKPEPVLNETAASHAEYSSRTGRIGHDNFKERWSIVRQKLKHISFSENCSYIPGSKNDGLYFILSLLIDDENPGYGHRYAILNRNFQFIGVAIRNFPKNQFCLIQEFSTPRSVSQ